MSGVVQPLNGVRCVVCDLRADLLVVTGSVREVFHAGRKRPCRPEPGETHRGLTHIESAREVNHDVVTGAGSVPAGVSQVA